MNLIEFKRYRNWKNNIYEALILNTVFENHLKGLISRKNSNFCAKNQHWILQLMFGAKTDKKKSDFFDSF